MKSVDEARGSFAVHQRSVVGKLREENGALEIILKMNNCFRVGLGFFVAVVSCCIVLCSVVLNSCGV